MIQHLVWNVRELANQWLNSLYPLEFAYSDDRIQGIIES